MGPGLSDIMELETPKKTRYPLETTPRRSERKRALFPTASPQTSDLGHMSPLGSSPDRFSSAPPSPDSLCHSPIGKCSGPVSPFGRKAALKASLLVSPRKQFSLLLHKGSEEDTGTQKCDIPPSKKPLQKAKDIVPFDELEQTVLSTLDCPASPLSDHTPGVTPRSKGDCEALAEIKSSQPLTPNKRRSMPADKSGSGTSVSPQSRERKRRLSLEVRSRSASAELPRVRTSLFSSATCSSRRKRTRDDGIYLTARGGKRRKTYGEINAGVSSGIRRPRKVNPKPKASVKKRGKVKSVWDVGPATKSVKKSISPIKLPQFTILAQHQKKSDEEVAALSASASVLVRSKRSTSIKEAQSVEKSDEELTEEETPEPDPSKRFFKGKARTATVTILKNLRLKIHRGKMSVDQSTLPPPAKRRRQLYSQKNQIEAIQAFEDTEEDFADSTKKDVQNILQKLEVDNCTSLDTHLSSDVPLATLMPLPKDVEPAVGLLPEIDQSSVSSPAKSPCDAEESLMSPLSQLASSTSTLTLDVGGDTLHLTQAQVDALSAVPDVVMEEDDLLLCEPLPEEEPENQRSEQTEKENVLNESDSASVKYFPIFNSDFSHPKVSPPPVAKRKRSLLRPIGNDQYQLDAGQKRFGATECGTCGAIFQMGEPEDEIAHQEFHDAVKDLKFLGWKNEHVVGEYGRDRVVVVRPKDPKAWWCKAVNIMQVVDKDLGFADGVNCDPDNSMLFLYIVDKSVVGCLLAVPLKKAHKMLKTSIEAEGIDCCTSEEYPVKCGVSRIWVHRPHRQKGIAGRLMDCMRKNFIFGEVLSVDEIAFSAPTVLGKIFAEHYTKQMDFRVFVNSIQ